LPLLEHLRIAGFGNSFGDAACEAIAQKCQRIRELAIWSMPCVTQRGLTALIQSCKGLRTFTGN
jgi:hypothetical protein